MSRPNPIAEGLCWCGREFGHVEYVPPGRAAQSLWCDRNWHDGTCCAGSIRQWHQDRQLNPPGPGHERGDHSACNRNCEATL